MRNKIKKRLGKLLDLSKCPSGHKCHLNDKLYLYKDSDGNNITEFKCKVCEGEDNCPESVQEGSYVCA